MEYVFYLLSFFGAIGMFIYACVRLLTGVAGSIFKQDDGTSFRRYQNIKVLVLFLISFLLFAICSHYAEIIIWS